MIKPMMAAAAAVAVSALMAAGCASGASHQPAPAVTVTQQAAPAATKTVQPPPPPRPAKTVLLDARGSGQWNSQPFTVSGDSPQLRLVYSYSGNTDGFGPDNFMADLVSSTDDQIIANDIAITGGKVTMIYPDVTFGGSRTYHLEVQATGAWHFRVVEIGP